MREFINKAVAAILVAGLVCSCAGNPGMFENPAPELNLRVQDETYLDGGTVGKVTLNMVPSASGHTVEIAVEGAESLKALFFELDYDAKLWHPVECGSSGLLGGEADPVALSHLGTPGVVSHGQVIANYALQPGFSGAGVIACIEFAPGAVDKTPSQYYDPYPPLKDFPFIPDKSRMFVNHKTDTMRWYYEYRGDYNQDGEVNLADITPIALHFGEWNPNPGDNPWPYEGVLRLIDGDSNGEINLTDLTPISLHYGNIISQYNTYSTKEYVADYPQAGNHQHSKEPFQEVLFSESQGNAATERIWWERTIGGLDYFALYWAQPVINGALGQPSIVALEEETEFPRLEPLFDLAYSDGELSWHFNLRGDGYHDAEINLADLTGIATNMFNDASGPYQVSDPHYFADYDRDGYLRRDDDVFVLSFHYGSHLEKMEIYTSSFLGDASHDPQQDPTIEPLAVMPWYEYISTGELSRTRYNYSVEAPSGAYFWIRPTDGTNPGPRSEVIQIP